jgi:hypothetical protein
MDASQTYLLERIARVLAGQKLSANANGGARSSGQAVDRTWRDHLGDAAAVLNALREPDAQMLDVGDGEAWTRMVRAALGEDVQILKQERRSWRASPEIYQKPLG